MSIVSLLRSSLHRFTFAGALLLAFSPLALRAQTGTPSAADGFDPNVNGIVYALAMQPDGKVLVAGKFSAFQPNGAGTGTTRNNLARLNPDGSLDPTFNPNVNNQINVIVLQPDGKIVIGGVFTSVGGTQRVCVARLNADGSLDPTLNCNFANTPSPAIYAVALQPDGKIVVGGAFTAVVPAGATTATVRNRIARFNADGSLDTSYNPNANSTVYSLAAQPDGRLVVGGLFTTLQPSGDPTTRNHVARLNADGSIDAAFDPNTDASVMVLTLQPDGGILMGGFFMSVNPSYSDTPTSRNHMARFNYDGSLDTTFDPRPTANPTAITVQSDGGILVGGTFTSVGGGTRSYFARIASTGLLDGSFDTGVNFTVNAIAQQGDGKIVIGGNFIQLHPLAGLPTTRNHLARVHLDGTPDVNFDPNISGRLSALAQQADGKVIFGGLFSSVGGLARSNLARSNADGTIDGSFDPNVNGVVSALAVQSDGKILVGGTFSTVGGIPRNNFARLNSDGSVDLGFDPSPNSTVAAIAIQSDNKILIAGYFAGVQPNGAADVTVRGNLARINTDGTLDTTFTPLFNGEVLALKILSDGRILAAGNFIALQPSSGALFPTSQSFIIRLSSSGVVDQTFSAGPDNKIESFVVQSDGKIVVGGIFTQFEPNPLIAPTLSSHVARLNTNGSIDTTYDQSASGEVRTVALQNDGKVLIGGAFLTVKPNTSTDPVARPYLARLNTDGTVDTGFNANLGGAVNTLLVQSDGKVLLGGAFTTLQPNGTANVTARTHLARLNQDGTLDAAYDPTFANAPGSVVKTLSVQSDGKVLLGGSFGKIAGSQGDNLVRFKADGSLDSTFNPGADGAVNAVAVQTNRGLLTTQGNAFAWLGSDGLPKSGFNPSSNLQLVGQVNSVATQTDGSLLVAGAFANLSGATNGNLVRIKADGTLDTSFNPDPNSQVNAVVVQPDGKILIAGVFTSVQPAGDSASTPRNHIARLNADGTLDTSFDPNANDQINAMILQPDGRILVGGAFTTFQPNGASTATTCVRLGRLNTDGTLDTTFLPAPNDQVFALTLQPDGKILVGGNFTTFQPSSTSTPITRNRIGRLNADGTVDTTFDPDANNTVLAMRVQPDGSILLAGSFTTIGGWNNTGVARVSSTGANDPNFNVTVNGTVSGLVLLPNNQFVIVGAFTSVDGTTRNNIARINSNATLDTTFDPNLDGQANTLLLLPDGSLLVGGVFTGLRPYGVIMIGGSFSHVSGAAVANLALLNEDGNANGAFLPNPNGVVNALAVQPDGRVLVGGAFTTIGGVARGRMARFNADGTLDGTFNPGADGQVLAIAVQTDGKIVIGGVFANVGGAARARLARLNADGTLDGSFNPGANDAVNTLVIQSDGSILAGGAFTTVGGAGRSRLARINSSGGLDGGFTPAANGAVDGLSLQADGQVIVAGAFTSINGTTRNYLARVTATGALDSGFDPSADGEVSAVVLQPDGKPLIGGAFSRVGGQARYRFARLSTTSPAAQSLTLSSDYATLTWTRGGSSPEVAWVTFEQSSDGDNWTTLGQATRVGSTGWQLSASTLPTTSAFFVRARGALPSGEYSSSGLIETVKKFFPPISGAPTDVSGGSNSGTLIQYSATSLPSGLRINPATGIISGTAASGTYSVTITAGTTSSTQTLVFGSAASGARTHPVNSSTRAFVSDGHPIFLGFVVTGPESKTVLLRGVGPTLSSFDVQGVLAQPHLKLFNAAGQLLLQNDGWANNSDLAAAFTTIGTFPFASGSADAAMVTTLAPGAYTMQVVASPGASGIALAEVYDAGSNQSADTARFGNMSARGPSNGGNNPLIAGFVINGTTPKRMLVRGIGPALTGYGVTDALTDSVVGVYDSSGRLIAQNDNWGTPLTVDPSQPAADPATIAASSSAVGAFSLASGSRDAVVIVTLAPGLYTVQVSGLNGTTGSALAELYELP
ncbi:MAG TPA: putative Ig domain-containing protein [Opitutaceae bacterium]|nr:putative Ig domain-containing protein [Opitutaceae bacterium]